MNIELIYVLIAIAVGFGATLVMDLWGIFPQTHLQHPFAQLLLCGSLAALHA